MIGTALRGEGVQVRITNDETQDIVVTVYDMNANPRAILPQNAQARAMTPQSMCTPIRAARLKTLAAKQLPPSRHAQSEQTEQRRQLERSAAARTRRGLGHRCIYR
jgi:hypothetical protein